MSFQDSLLKLSQNTVFTKDCTVNDVVIAQRVLSFREEAQLSKLIEALSDNEDISVLGDWKKHLLAMSITKIDGVEIPDVVEVEGERIEKTLYLKDFLDKLPTRIIDTLFIIYTDLKEESEASIDKEIVYSWFKDPETRGREQNKTLEGDSGNSEDSGEADLEENKNREEDIELSEEDDVVLKKI